MKIKTISKILKTIGIGLIGTTIMITPASAVSTNNMTKSTTAANSGFLKVSYVDLSATGALALVNPMSTYAAADIIVFAFAQPDTTEINQSYLSNMLAIEKAAPNSKFFLSVGGATSTQMTDGRVGGANILAQVQGYRDLGIRIDGVDMDFEHGEDMSNLSYFAKIIKYNGTLLLSAAPQLYFNGDNCSAITSDNVTSCLAFSSGGPNNNYAVTMSLDQQYFDYLWPQAYNSPNFTINGYNETQVQFYNAAASAVSTYVKYLATLGSNPYTVTTKIAIGEPVNRAAGSLNGTIYGTSPSYDQASKLSQLLTQINMSLQYPLIAGTMMWSVNADYDPLDFGDSSAKQGAYSTTIFGAPAPAKQNLQLQFTNNSSGSSAIVTLVVNGSQYYAFYANPSGQNPIAAGQNAMWCSMDIANPNCLNNLNLNQITPGSSYRVQVSPNGNTQQAWLCPGTYTLTSGYHNIQVNNDAKACAVS